MVVGGGYGGVTVAKGLDDVADVVLVEPKEAFLHNVAALRALVDPSWLPKVFMPYGGLLRRGRVVQDRAVQVDPGRVVTASGEEIEADYVVLASGSTYPFPAKTDLVDTEAAHRQFRAVNEALAGAGRVLLVGAGPVGVELAGEIHAVWPDKSITLLDAAGQLLGGRFKDELKAELRRQLVELGVELVLGSPLLALPPTAPGEPGTFTVSTDDGVAVTADIWFRCFGVVPSSDYLGGFSRLGPHRRRVRRGRAHPAGGRPGDRVRPRGPVDGRCQDGRASPGGRPRWWSTTSPPWPPVGPSWPGTRPWGRPGSSSPSAPPGAAVSFPDRTGSSLPRPWPT